MSHPLRRFDGVEATSLRFAAAARTLAMVARRGHLVVPGFRSPPRVVDTVSIRGRPWSAVVSDMVEGVVAANRLSGRDADGVRRALWAGLEAEALLPSLVPPAPPARAGRHLRVAGAAEAA